MLSINVLFFSCAWYANALRLTSGGEEPPQAKINMDTNIQTFSNGRKKGQVDPDQKMKTCPEHGLTAFGHFDGFGATYSGLISVYFYAALQHRIFCPTRWTHTSHNVSMPYMFDWVGGSELGPPATPQTEVKHHWTLNALGDVSPNTIKHVRDAYFNSEDKRALNLFAGTTGASENIAWHIRRGDVDEGKGKRFTSNADIEQGLDTLCRVHSPRVTVVHFFSQGPENDFQSIHDKCAQLNVKCVWHLDEPVDATHYSLSIADVLVMACSSFSSTAGVLNNGTVLKDTDLLSPDYILIAQNTGTMQSLALHTKVEHMMDVLAMNVEEAGLELDSDF